jgi:sugar/nucleoside kinase (ribokinase family)
MKRLGIVGSLVWDRIWPWTPAGPAALPTEAWGGVTYSLAAASAACPPGWSVAPVLKLGRDRADQALDLLRALPHLDLTRLATVDEPTNRVELRYHDPARRREQLTGGVSAWSTGELLPRLAGLDALYLNYISGAETSLDTAQALRRAFPGPIYCDLHSLLLGTAADGRRTLRPLPAWREWMRCFDAVQMNEDEMRALCGARARFSDFAGDVLREGPSLVLVTRGAAGVDYALASGTLLSPAADRDGSVGAVGRVVHHDRLDGDPTGCGDVWGVTLFLSLLQGQPLTAALGAAHAAARRKLSHSGAGGLQRHLQPAAQPNA